jgi:hypothetical protein
MYEYYLIWYKEINPFEEMVSNGKKFDDFITIPRKICSIINRINRKTLKMQFSTDM